MRGSSILHGEGRKVPPVNLFNRIKQPLFARGLQSVRLLRPPPLLLSDYRTRRGIEKSAYGHPIPRLDINQEIPRTWFGLQATNRLHFSPNLSFEVARLVFPGIFLFLRSGNFQWWPIL
jgi:hypothetical protein